MSATSKDEAGPSSPKTAGRGYRSRRSRPCDRCRKGKQLCLIMTKGEACGGCIARKQPCTFDIPPLPRHGKRSSGSPDRWQPASTSPVTSTFPSSSRAAPLELGPNTSEPNFGDMAVGLGVPGLSTHQVIGWGRPGPNVTGLDTRDATRPSIPGTAANPAVGTSSLDLMNVEPLTLPGIDIWQSLFRPDAATGAADLSTNPVSLDLESGEGMESHFLGTGTFRGLTLREINTATQSIPNRPGMVEFRQVSANEAHPVYFVRHPSLQYGQAPENGKAAWDNVTKLCAHLGNSTLTQALYILRTTLLPALPVVNYPQFEQACRGVEGSGPIPYALLAATIAHPASYMPTLRPLHQQLWAHVLNAIDAEFRQPRLMTLQLVVLLLSSRPGVNFAQSDMTLARAAGAVHVLGLHIDPSEWSLPRWERSLRIRLFWTVLFHDKIRALLLGRPSHLHSDNYTTPMPTVEDARYVEEGEAAELDHDHQVSLETFVANCRLVPIIDRLLAGFMTLKAAREPSSYLSRIVLLGEIRFELDMLASSLPFSVGDLEASRVVHGTLATGVRSFQVTLCGLRTILHRLELDIIDRRGPSHILGSVYESAMSTATAAVFLVLELSPADRLMFWMPYTFHHMSNVGSLLLRIASECRLTDIALSTKAISLAITFCSTLARYLREDQWDMADETLKRLAEPAFTVGKGCIQAREVYKIISDALGYEMSDAAWDDMTVANHFGFINDGFDPSIWTVDGMSWLNN